jgi:hypothetical protein
LDGEKRQHWERIKQEAPEAAEFVSAVSAVFGKLAAVRVDLPSGDVVAYGELDDKGEVWDGSLRRMKYSEGWK